MYSVFVQLLSFSMSLFYDSAVLLSRATAHYFLLLGSVSFYGDTLFPS